MSRLPGRVFFAYARRGVFVDDQNLYHLENRPLGGSRLARDPPIPSPVPPHRIPHSPPHAPLPNPFALSLSKRGPPVLTTHSTRITPALPPQRPRAPHPGRRGGSRTARPRERAPTLTRTPRANANPTTPPIVVPALAGTQGRGAARGVSVPHRIPHSPPHAPLPNPFALSLSKPVLRALEGGPPPAAPASPPPSCAPPRS